MRPWTTGRRWRCTWQRDGVWWCESTGSRAKKMENSLCTHGGGCASAAARAPGRVSRAACPLYLRNRVSWSSQMGAPLAVSDVAFDATREIEGQRWIQNVPNGPWQPVPGSARSFGPGVENVNDDAGDRGESDRPTPIGAFYDEDPPGPTGLEPYSGDKWRYNFWEWIRVRFDGTRPTGNGVSGSRSSPKYAWSVAHTLYKEAGAWHRTTGDDVETEENTIRVGHIPIS